MFGLKRIQEVIAGFPFTQWPILYEIVQKL